jgi:RNA recognition motif-containing protein
MSEKKAPEDYHMALDDIIKKQKKDGKNGPSLNKRRRRNFFKNRYSKEKVDNRRRIRVENLGKDIQNPDLINLFEKYGKLSRCGIKFDKLGKSMGIADVEYATHEECKNAIYKLDHAQINGEEIRVKYAPNPGRFRRTRSAGFQKRKIRRINRSTRGRTTRIRRRIGTRRTRAGTGTQKSSDRPNRRYFTKTLGRRRK